MSGGPPPNAPPHPAPERELVSLAFAERRDELWVMDETRVLARLGPDARQPPPR